MIILNKTEIVFFSLKCSLLLEFLNFQNLFISTAAGVVPYGGREHLSVHHYNADYIFWSFGIIRFI